MADVVVREVEAVAPQQLDALIADHSFGDYRRVRGITTAAALRFMTGRLGQALATPRTTTLLAEDRADGAPAGLLLLQRIAQDSELLGLEVAGLPFLLVRADHPSPREVYDALLSGLSFLARREGYVHLSARTDTENLPAYQALTDAGFRLMETLVTMSYDTERRGAGIVAPEEYDFDGVVRPATASDAAALRDIASRRFTQNRYHRDHELPDDRAGELMARWIESYREDPEDHEVWVAEGRGGEIAGFLGHGLNRELQAQSGVLISGRALLATENPRNRVGQMLSRAHTWQSRGDFKEADTQLDNYGMIKVAFNLDMDLVRTRYTFHKSLR